MMLSPHPIGGEVWRACWNVMIAEARKQREWQQHITPAGVCVILTKRAEKLEREAAALRRLAETDNG